MTNPTTIIYHEFDKLNQITTNEHVLIIGVSLSAIDCSLLLESNGHKGLVGFMSRSGIIPKIRLLNVRSESSVFEQLIKNKCKLSLLDLVQGFKKQIKHLDSGCSWKDLFSRQNKLHPDVLCDEINKQKDIVQEILISSNSYTENIWDALSDSDKIKFFNKFYTLYMSNRNPMPNIFAKKLLKQLQKNKLKIFSSDILSIVFNNNKFTITFVSGNLEIFDWVINATGQSKNIEIKPLYDNLLKYKLIRKNIIGGIEVTKDNQHCINANGNITSGLYAIGPKTLGTYINVNSAEMLSILFSVMFLLLGMLVVRNSF